MHLWPPTLRGDPMSDAVQEARDVAASLLRAADVLEAHLTGEAQ
jgi:hypothetical protein